MDSQHIKSISQYHQLMELPKPMHPLISVINFADVKRHFDEKMSLVIDFYSIGLKRNFNGKLKYGQQQYDFDEGILTFMSPKQVLGIEGEKGVEPSHTGWLLLIHPDFLWNSVLARNIKRYEFFTYSVNEALFLSKKEETTISAIMNHIEQEYHSNIDNYSQDIIIAQIELLLNYAERYYNRQFLTRKKSNHQILERLDNLLTEYFREDNLTNRGLPTFKSICENLNVSVSYLGRVLKVLTGQNTQQHIHNKLIEKAKEKLSTTELSVSEIAFELGFEHSQSFSKLFKSKTNQSPMEYRASFN